MRSVRLALYFLVGFLLSINAGLASAWIAKGDGWAITRDSSGRPVTLHFEPSSGQGVTATAEHPRTVQGGAAPVSSPVTVKQRIPKSVVADLAKKAARGTLPGVAVGLVAPVLLDAGIECLTGGECKLSNPPTDPLGDQIPATIKEVTTGYVAAYSNSSVWPDGWWYGTTPSAACLAFKNGWGGLSGYSLISSSSNMCHFRDPWGNNSYNVVYGGKTCDGVHGTQSTSCGYTCPTNGGWIMNGSGSSTVCSRTPCTENQYRDQFGVCQAAGLSEAQLDQLLQDVADTYNASQFVDAVADAGVPVPADEPIVSGPASVSSAPITRQTIKDGQTLTTTTTTTVNNTYNDNSVTSTVTNSSVTTNQAGQVVETTTENMQPQEETVVSDTALGDVPVLYERKYPDGLTGIWNTRKAELMATPLFGLSAVFTPNISGGSCPSWGMGFNIGANMNYGTGAFDVPCWVWDVVKVIMIISALLLARRLVFGG